MSGVCSPHLQRRNGIFHLRMRVPDRLRPRLERIEINRSLKTYSSMTARKLSANVLVSLQETLTMVENDIQITPEKARAMVQSCFEEFKYSNDLHAPFSINTANPDIKIAEQEILSQAKINDLVNQASCRTFNKDVQIRTSEYCQRKHIDFDALNAKDQSRLLYAFAQVLIEEQRYFQHRLNDPISTYQPYNSIFNNVESEYSHQSTQHDKQNIEIGLTIKQAVEKYLSAKQKSWVHKTHKARIWQLRYLIEYIGHDRLMNSIVSSDIREFRDKLIKLRAKHGQGRSLSFFEKLTDNENAQIKNKTARLIYEPTKAFFKWAKSEEGLIEKNPAEDVKWNTLKTKKEPKSRRPFTETELLKLFNSPLYKGCKSKHRRFLEGEKIYKDARGSVDKVGSQTVLNLIQDSF